MKLVFEYYWDIPYETSGVECFAIEYKSKLSLQVKILDIIKEARKQKGSTHEIKIFDWHFWSGEFDDLERQIQSNVYTLDEWFEMKKFDLD